MANAYRPPYTLTPVILQLVEEIGEWLGRYSAEANVMPPRLRRENRIRTVQASLSIEHNTLTLAQVTAVIAGKRVLGLPREIQEVRNAFAAYERMDQWEPSSRKDLLGAHALLMAGLVDRPGEIRRGGVGVFRGDRAVFMAPPANRVSDLVNDLLAWLKKTDEHSLIASCVFHYEFEFIHPFGDGNGRLGRLWQTLILSKWKPLLACLPVETVIRDRQSEYYRVLREADANAEATPFIEFLLGAIRDAIKQAVASDQVTDHVSDQVIRLMGVLGGNELGASDLMQSLGLSHRPTFRRNYLEPALAAGFIKRTQPDSPRSPTQRYRLTVKGRNTLKKMKRE